jgi:hypothetical protein
LTIAEKDIQVLLRKPRLVGDPRESRDDFIARSLENAQRYRWTTQTANGKNIVVPLPTASLGRKLRGGEGPGSFLTGTQTELIFASRTAATQVTFASTGEVTITAGITELGTTAGTINLGLPANHFGANNGVGRVVRVVARGNYNTTASPTFTFGLRMVSAAGALQATSGALTGGATVTNMPWQWECDMVGITVGPTTTATCRVTGMVWLTQALTGGTPQVGVFCAGSAFGTPTPATPTGAGFDSTIANALVATGNTGTASVSNALQLMEILVFGLN